MSTLKFNQWLNTDNTENYKCRAWVNFNGTGTVAIRASGNVSSITDNGTGDYTVNFTTALADANYSYVVSSQSAVATSTVAINLNETGAAASSTPNTGSCRFTIYGGGAYRDITFINVAAFR